MRVEIIARLSYISTLNSTLSTLRILFFREGSGRGSKEPDQFLAFGGYAVVFGIGQIVVKPPRAAAVVPVLIVSLCSNPGSLK